jgi:Domain of unknown function (DUF4384)
MKGAALYLAGAIASVAAHVGVGLALPIILAPEPIETQPRPKSQVQIETQEVARTQAAAIAPDSAEVATEGTAGAQLAQGAIAQSRATPVTPPAETTLASTPQTPVTIAISPAVTPVAASPAPASVIQPSPPPATLIATTANVAPMLSASPPPVTQTSVSDPPALALAASPAPVVLTSASTAPAQVVAASASTATPLAASPALAKPLTDSTASQISPSPAIPPPSEHFTAALAFSGGAGAQIDAASLATIQSFMRPGDMQAQTDQVRDAMQTLLESVPCSRLQAQFNPETGSIELRGHVPEEGLRGPILAALQAQVGTGIRVDDAMLILPRPQCGALSGIGAVGLPQSTDQLTNPLLVGADAQERTYDYRQGDQMVLDLAAPDYDAYIYVDFFDANGDVIHLVPNDTVPLALHPAQSAMRIGAGDGGTPYLNITIGPPYGQEIAAAFAASAPLYDGVRPLSEPAEPYLDWMAGQVAAARAANPDFKGEWVYFFVSTAEH